MSRAKLRFALLFLSLSTLASCQGRCFGGPRPTQNGPDSVASMEPTFSAEAVSYCRERSTAPPQAQVQLLIDASGSMNGFTESMPGLVAWVEHAVSGLRGSSLELADAQTCQFNKRDGLFGCVPSLSLPEFTPASQTNLHQAIRAAINADLTFLVTDGVAATGETGDGDCATGVDAACVARALRDVVRPESAGGEGSNFSDRAEESNPGIWILPLVTAHNGRLYTEEAISPGDFEPNATMEEIRAQLAKETIVRDPRLGSDGLLHFYYQGPKALLLIVIARQAELGRDAVWSLWNQASLRGVTRLDDPKSFSEGLGSLPPIEVYPGFLSRIRFESLEASDEPSEHRGTLDVDFVSGDARSRIRLNCPLNGSGEGVFLLGGERRDRQRSATCVPIQQLPAYSLQLEPLRGKADKDDMDKIIRGYQHDAAAGVLRLDLACGSGPRRPCDSQPLPVRWNALRDYGHTAEGIATAEPRGIALASVQEASTAQPSREPHRVFGLAATLQAFYELVEQEARRLPLAEFELCNGSTQ